MKRSNLLRRKPLLVSLVVVLLLSLASWFAFSAIVWRIPAQPGTYAMALADLDGDGDLDAFLANGRHEAAEPNTVLMNDGAGHFVDSGQRLGNFESSGVVLHDFDGDGDVDALVSNSAWGEYFYNEGDGTFSRSESLSVPTVGDYVIGKWLFAPADLNDDGHTDLFLAACCGGGTFDGPDGWQTLNPYNTVWLATDGALAPTGQQLGAGSTAAVALADVDGDGDVDAFGANRFLLDPAGELRSDANNVWFNDGNGTFVDSGQHLGSRRSSAVALGDLDGDGDLDALVGNDGPDEVWWNDGHGIFADSGQALGDNATSVVNLADFDGDGDLDALLAGATQASLWSNDGSGHFRYSGQRFRYRGRYGVASGDVDGDGMVDVIAARLDRALVWRNDGAGNLRR